MEATSAPIVISERIEEVYEVCPSCGGMMKAGRYVCKSCQRQPRSPMVLVADQPEYSPKRYSRDLLHKDICDYCPKLIPCGIRVMEGGCCFCEIPCEDDLLIVALGGE